MTHRIAIIGAGVIGRKRAEALKMFSRCELVVTADVDAARAKKLAADFGGAVETNWKKAVRRKDIDIVIVATVNAVAAQITIEALKHGKHVLCEKPLGITSRQSRKILETAQKYNRLAKPGFNHRFHPALMKAKQLCNSGAIGTLLFIRARYGHGGRQGMEKEWRLDRKVAGGGELLDQGIHIIDLCRWFAGDFTDILADCDTKFWKTNVEDNAFVIMRNKRVTASFHVSTTNWGNIFSFELFGDRGAITVEGLGKRYGVETLTLGKRQAPFNNLKTKTIRYSSSIDLSWREEWKNFLQAIEKKSDLIGTADDGLRANEIVEAAYASSKKRKGVRL